MKQDRVVVPQVSSPLSAGTNPPLALGSAESCNCPRVSLLRWRRRETLSGACRGAGDQGVEVM